MHSLSQIVRLMRCIECGAEQLNYHKNIVICENCKREYTYNDKILSMMPSTLSKIKQNEVDSRDDDAQFYDSKRPDDYTFLIDHYCINNNKNKINPHSIVLDMACGTGRSTLLLSRYVKTVISVDFSYKSLKILHEKLKKERNNNIFTVHADVNSMPFSVKDYFDFINCEEFLQHIPSFYQREKLLKDLYNLLKKNGYIALTAYYYNQKKKKDNFINLNELGEKGKQGFHNGKIYYYNFDLAELYVTCVEQGFKVVDHKLFYLDLPLWARALHKIKKINRLRLENILFSYYKKNANRIYMLLQK